MLLRFQIIAGLLCLGACTDAPSSAPETASFDGPWAFLEVTYDSDGDGAVTRDEHGRTARSFDRLDRDKDGVLTAADFAKRPGGVKRKAANRAVHLLGRYVQHDEDDAQLGGEELARAFARQDTDGDGLLAEEEFRCGQLAAGTWGPERDPEVARLLDDVDPWDGLLAALDADTDDALSLDELLDFHRRRTGGAPWVWTVPTEDDLAARRPLQGLPAPDFSLSPLRGGPKVTLSSFRGDRPVALIFGSYT